MLLRGVSSSNCHKFTEYALFIDTERKPCLPKTCPVKDFSNLYSEFFSTNFNNCTIEGYFVGEFKKPEVEPLYKKDGTVKNQIIDQSVFYQMLIKSTRD